jgi:hypothetical protein
LHDKNIWGKAKKKRSICASDVCDLEINIKVDIILKAASSMFGNICVRVKVSDLKKEEKNGLKFKQITMRQFVMILLT